MINEEKLAVKYGYWHLYRYNPSLVKQGKNPFVLDSSAPTGDLKEFLYKEVRYESLTRQFREEAERLHALLIEDKQKVFFNLLLLVYYYYYYYFRIMKSIKPWLLKYQRNNNFFFFFHF
jgi:pyruvate-ferredoxin/flavodoxin oxidoreductase